MGDIVGGLFGGGKGGSAPAPASNTTVVNKQQDNSLWNLAQQQNQQQMPGFNLGGIQQGAPQQQQQQAPFSSFGNQLAGLQQQLFSPQQIAAASLPPVASASANQMAANAISQSFQQQMNPVNRYAQGQR